MKKESTAVQGGEIAAVVREGESAAVQGEGEIAAVEGEIAAFGGGEIAVVEEVEEAIGVHGVGAAGVMEVIKVVEVKSSADQRKNRTQDGPAPENKQIKGRVYCNKCSKSYTEQKALTRHQKQ